MRVRCLLHIQNGNIHRLGPSQRTYADQCLVAGNLVVNIVIPDTNEISIMDLQEIQERIQSGVPIEASLQIRTSLTRSIERFDREARISERVNRHNPRRVSGPVPQPVPQPVPASMQRALRAWDEVKKKGVQDDRPRDPETGKYLKKDAPRPLPAPKQPKRAIKL